MTKTNVHTMEDIRANEEETITTALKKCYQLLSSFSKENNSLKEEVHGLEYVNTEDKKYIDRLHQKIKSLETRLEQIKVKNTNEMTEINSEMNSISAFTEQLGKRLSDKEKKKVEEKYKNRIASQLY